MPRRHGSYRPHKIKANNTHPIDVWLARGSHSAQIGLLLLAGFGFFYTVLPLYQKAVLDEEIAQQKILLSKQQTDLQANYKMLRNYVTSRIIFSIGAECSGLLIPPDELPLTPSAPSDEAHAEMNKILEIDPRKCLASNSEARIASSKLTESDKNYFRKKISATATKLEVLRKAAIKNFTTFPVRAKQNPRLLTGPKLHRKSNTEKLLDSTFANSDKLQKGFLVYQKQQEIAFGYADQVRDEVNKLHSVWK